MFNQLKEKLTKYIDARLKLYQYNITDKVVKICINAFILLVMYLFLLGAIFFISVASSLILNKFFSSYYLGYFTVSFFYIFAFLFLLLTRKGKFWQRLKDKIVDKLTE